MAKIAEYRDIKEQPKAQCEVVASAPTRIGYSERFETCELQRVSAGWEPAGSVARWTDGYWAVRYWLDGAQHGKSFYLTPEGEQKARALFAKWTADEEEEEED